MGFARGRIEGYLGYFPGEKQAFQTGLATLGFSAPGTSGTTPKRDLHADSSGDCAVYLASLAPFLPSCGTWMQMML